VKLRWRKTRTYKGEDYGKWVLHPPTAAIDALGWKDGDELAHAVEGGALVLRKAPKKREAQTRRTPRSP